MGDLVPVDRTTVVLSIRPVYADRILAGTKTIEFRRKPLPSMVSTVLIWRAGPSGGVVGKFRLEHPEESHRAGWFAVEQSDGSRIIQPEAGVSAEDLIAYAGGEFGHLWALGVRDATRYQQTDRLGWSRGPQSWQYAPADWRTVLEVAW